MRKFFIRASVLVQKRRISVQVPWSSASPRDGSSAGEAEPKAWAQGSEARAETPQGTLCLCVAASRSMAAPSRVSLPSLPCAVCHQQPVPVCVWASPSGRLPCFALGVVVCCRASDPRGGVISIRLGLQVLSAGSARQLHKPAPSQPPPLPAPRPQPRAAGREELGALITASGFSSQACSGGIRDQTERQLFLLNPLLIFSWKCSAKSPLCAFFLQSLTYGEERNPNRGQVQAHDPVPGRDHILSLQPSSFHLRISRFIPVVAFKPPAEVCNPVLCLSTAQVLLSPQESVRGGFPSQQITGTTPLLRTELASK